MKKRTWTDFERGGDIMTQLVLNLWSLHEVHGLPYSYSFSLNL